MRAHLLPAAGDGLLDVTFLPPRISSKRDTPSTPSLLLAVVLVFTALGTSCKGRSPAPTVSPLSAPEIQVSRVVVRDLTEEASRGSYVLPDLRPTLTKAVPAGSLLRLPKVGAPTAAQAESKTVLHVAVLYGLVSAEGQSILESEAGARITAGVQLNLALVVPGGPSVVLQAERIGDEAIPAATAIEDAHELSTALLRRLSMSALRALDQRVTISRGSEDVVLAGLDARDAGVQAYAIEQVGERGLASATPRLVKLLANEDAELRLRAIGALGLLRAPVATAPLAKLAGGNEHPREIAAAINALADIGTPEARRYLESVRDTSLFDDVKRLADEALAR
jgi:hypothetical protein